MSIFDNKDNLTASAKINAIEGTLADIQFNELTAIFRLLHTEDTCDLFGKQIKVGNYCIKINNTEQFAFHDENGDVKCPISAGYEICKIVKVTKRQITYKHLSKPDSRWKDPEWIVSCNDSKKFIILTDEQAYKVVNRILDMKNSINNFIDEHPLFNRGKKL